MAIRVLICDDHMMVRQGVRMVLQSEPDLELVGEAGRGDEVVELTKQLRPDVVIMDISLPDMSGIEATRLIKQAVPETRVIGLTMHEEEPFVLEFFRAGADAYIVKRSAAADLVGAIRAVMEGQAVLDPAVTRAVVSGYVSRPVPAAGQSAEPCPLTPREREILILVAEGLTNAEIARRLFISEKTVQTHRSNMLDKLGIHDRTELVRYAIRQGLVEP
ncbi:DNA-binding NarL/FixJ family response regulator [Symbiobacterium terraclitae]|uniref:Stage 0 sporulation protein A homolog n=1 Tax=Symbiobacterium terraclitae TaxID=557451 RepID=A0ABS4JRM6_9FIRM|nr:DNA-binding NarL/FixJ family response regulator [Symbiobacterium terraclitae]